MTSEGKGAGWKLCFFLDVVSASFPQLVDLVL